MRSTRRQQRGYRVRTAGLQIDSYNDSTWLHSKIDDDWTLSYRLGYAEADGKIGIKELRIRPAYKSLDEVATRLPGGGITKALLKSIDLQGELRYGRAVLREQTLTPVVKRSRRRTRGRPRVLSAKFRDELRQAYERLVEQRVPNFAEILAQPFGYRRNSMRCLLARCYKEWRSAGMKRRESRRRSGVR